MDRPVQGLPRYLLVAQTATLHTHTTLNTTPSILRVMIRELLATATVLRALATVRPHSKTNRMKRYVEESAALLVCWEG